MMTRPISDASRARGKEPDQHRKVLDDRTYASGEPLVWHALQTTPDPEATCCCGSGSTEFDDELTPSR